MDPIPHDRSHLTGTGPSSYGTGPIVFNKIGPVPTWIFSLINTMFSLMRARSHSFPDICTYNLDIISCAAVKEAVQGSEK